MSHALERHRCVSVLDFVAADIPGRARARKAFQNLIRRSGATANAEAVCEFLHKSFQRCALQPQPS
jgi:hypothetical protein